MRVLQITPQLPYPPDSGGRVGIFNSIKYGSRYHEITLLTFVSEDCKRHIQDLKNYCNDVVTVSHDTGNSYLAMVANLVSNRPYPIAKFASPTMFEEVRKLKASRRFDVVHVDHLHMAQYQRVIGQSIPTVLRQHNVESVIMQRYAEKARNPLKRSFAALQARRLSEYEARICRAFSCVVPVTDVDGATLVSMSPNTRVEVIPSGVDTEVFTQQSAAPEMEPYRLVTTGDYGWPPTSDGLRYLVEDILPLIRKRIPQAKLAIVGRNPLSNLQNLEDCGIDLIGRVEDVRPEILKSAVFVVPTRIGSGIRLKILEAMALERPVVSTSIGCEGIDVVRGKDLLVEDEPSGFAEAVVGLLECPDRGRSMAVSAHDLIRQKYSWDMLAKRFNTLYGSLV